MVFRASWQAGRLREREEVEQRVSKLHSLYTIIPFSVGLHDEKLMEFQCIFVDFNHLLTFYSTSTS